ncbi:MAG: helix-turn-helix domain-containing protein [Saprospiraceae bacterium]
MITSDDIKLLVSAGEGYNAEFKVAVPSKVKDLSEEICAFANASGGTLLIGVNDNNQIVGCIIENTKRPTYLSGQTTQKTTQKTVDRIIEILTLDPYASRSKITEILSGISEDGVKYQLNKLKRQGKIQRIGPDKGGYWKVTTPKS